MLFQQLASLESINFSAFDRFSIKGGLIERPCDFISWMHLGNRIARRRLARERRTMTRVVYVNGRYAPYADAAIHVEDRGFQFADGVYEVCEVRDGCLVDERRHMRRLDRSLRELGMAKPMGLKPLGVILRETVRRNRVRNGIVYLQVTRGVAHRDFAF